MLKRKEETKDILIRLGFLTPVHRKWSPTKTEDCPVPNPDYYSGGYLETDESFRARVVQHIKEKGDHQ